ncbi:MAG: S-methyl-5-thioribose-1-phosphate isomerase [Planctomycetota bacterium]
MQIYSIDWIGDEKGYLKLIDQTRLPHQLIYLKCHRLEQVVSAIKEMRVRGAPAIGVTAAFGAYLGIRNLRTTDYKDFYHKFSGFYKMLISTRPTAVNLKWALDRIDKVIRFYSLSSCFCDENIIAKVYNEALEIIKEDRETCYEIGINGVKLIKNNYTILTHCNAGLLATAGSGTALSVIYQAKKSGKIFSVFATETRPLLQGSRLTVWELQRNKVPVTLICDNMVGSLMRREKIDLIIVGADRIAKNGDTANKIGTYQVALLAHHHKIPFYVVAPLSTFENYASSSSRRRDKSIKTGKDIPIEYRSSDEVRYIGHTLITPRHTKVYNPAFDVTPAKYITGFITEKGIIR